MVGRVVACPVARAVAFFKPPPAGTRSVIAMTDMQDIPDETPARETGPAPAAPPAPAPPPISALLEAAADAALPVLRGVRDDQLELPTPCAEYDLRALLNHLFQVVVAFQALAAKKDVDFSTTPTGSANTARSGPTGSRRRRRGWSRRGRRRARRTA